MIVRPDPYVSPAMLNQSLKKVTIAVLVIALCMTLALTAGIALLFTVGKSAMKDDVNDKSTTTAIGATTTAIGAITTTTPSIVFEPCACGCPAISPEVTPRIVNGEAAIPNSWPWQLLLVVFTTQGLPSSYCGASLISPLHVLTAAHCVFGSSPRYVGFFSGLHFFNVSALIPSSAFFSQRIFVHESYDDATLNDDVAVIRLQAPVTIDERVSLGCIAPSSSSSDDLTEGEPFVATGWGALTSFNRTRPDRLQQVSVQYVPPSNPLCAALVGSGLNARPGQMCAGFPPRAVCFGDSGGPLVRSIVHPNGKTYWQQVGIMSGTVDCGFNTSFPDVYAKVSYYNPWIVDKMLRSP